MPPNTKGKKEVVIVEQNKRLNLLMFLYLKCMRNTSHSPGNGSLVT